MNDLTQLLLSDARIALMRELEDPSSGSLVERQFAFAVLNGVLSDVEIQTDLKEAVEATGAKRTYQYVAVLGFAAWSSLLDTQGTTVLLEGLHWNFGRAPVVDGVQMPFCRDVVALLGMALGVITVKDKKLIKSAADWLRMAVEAGQRDRNFDSWEQCLLSVIPEIFAGEVNLDVQCNSDFDADVRVALWRCGLLPRPSNPEVMIQDKISALQLIKSEAASKIGVAHAALRLVALESIKANQPTLTVHSISKDNVADLLRRFPAALKLWTWEEKPRTKTAKEPRRWDIDNEYHVQNLLWFLLVPLFPDLTEEEYTPKVGPVQPRADLGIPSLKLIIEVKFMRANDPAKKVIEEIAQDASLYLTLDSRYDSIIAFIWDDSRRGELHEETIKGLKAIGGVEDAVIVPRPGKMVK